MSTRRRSRIDRNAAERLLAGAAPHPQDERLAPLLAGMRAPGRSDELAGERAAVASYRAATLRPVRQNRRRSMLETAAAKLLTLKVAAAAAVVITATGGVALAASSGAPMRGDAPAARPSAHATGKPSTAGAKKASSTAPSPSLVGLCQAYAAGATDNPGKALDNPAFQALITAAGSKDDVDGYCDDTLAAREAGQTAADARTDRRSKAPTAHPTAAPESHPTGAPAGKSTDGAGGRPTAVPTARPTS